MNIQQTITDIENYALIVDEIKGAGTSLLASLDGFFDEIQQGKTFTLNDLLALQEQYKIIRCQDALTRALSKL